MAIHGKQTGNYDDMAAENGQLWHFKSNTWAIIAQDEQQIGNDGNTKVTCSLWWQYMVNKWALVAIHGEK